MSKAPLWTRDYELAGLQRLLDMEQDKTSFTARQLKERIESLKNSSVESVQIMATSELDKAITEDWLRASGAVLSYNAWRWKGEPLVVYEDQHDKGSWIVNVGGLVMSWAATRPRQIQNLRKALRGEA